MIKKILILTAFFAIAGVLIFGAVYRTQARGGAGGDGSQVSGSGYRGGSHEAIDATDGHLTDLPAADPSGVSPEEADALAYMREEEKLAHDVYLTLYDQWGIAVFQNIAASEQTHTTAVQALLDRYGLADPASSQVGVFTNPDLQALYDQLVAQGSQSLTEALKVGGAIEEIDILDLRTRLVQTDNLDILQVFNNLAKGSENHLRAFSRVFNTQTGEAYQPQYLSQADYQSILTTGASGSANGQGNGGQRNGGRGAGSGGGGRP